MNQILNDNFVVEIASMQDENKRIKMNLPVSKEVLEDTLEQLTGKSDGTEYVLLDGECPYFEISRHDELPLLNKISEISCRLTNDQRILLKNWCEHWEKDFCTDLTEITNAALQMNKVLYVDGVKSFDELGKAIVVTTNLLPDLEQKGLLPKIEKNISNYINFEAIGRDYELIGEGTNYPMMIEEKVLGYVLDDSEVNPQKFTKEELIEMDTEKLMFQSRDYIQESLKKNEKNWECNKDISYER